MIYLNERLAITADKYQYILGTPRERVSRDGKSTEIALSNPSYHRTLAQALKAAIAREMRRSVENDEIQTLGAFAQRLEAVTSDFEKQIEKINS